MRNQKMEGHGVAMKAMIDIDDMILLRRIFSRRLDELSSLMQMHEGVLSGVGEREIAATIKARDAVEAVYREQE